MDKEINNPAKKAHSILPHAPMLRNRARIVSRLPGSSIRNISHQAKVTGTRVVSMPKEIFRASHWMVYCLDDILSRAYWTMISCKHWLHQCLCTGNATKPLLLELPPGQCHWLSPHKLQKCEYAIHVTEISLLILVFSLNIVKMVPSSYFSLVVNVLSLMLWVSKMLIMPRLLSYCWSSFQEWRVPTF